MKQKINSVFKTLLLIVVFFISSQKVFSQESPEKNAYYQLEQEVMGMYQIQMISTRSKPMISTDLLELVKTNQLQSSKAYFLYRENIKIMILSKDEMATGVFVNNDEHIIYINEN